MALIAYVVAGDADGQPTDKVCSHLAEIADVTPSSTGCEDCLRMGTRWLHLRECLVCGTRAQADTRASVSGPIAASPPAASAGTSNLRAVDAGS